MKRIFPSRQLILGIFLGAFSLLMFFIALLPKDDIDIKAFLYSIFLFPFSLFFATTHTAYDSEFLISWTIFKRKKILIQDILEISRKWVSGGKSGAFHWYVSHFDRIDRRELTTHIFLPGNYKSKKVQEFLDFMKKTNHKIDFLLELR